jgi:hypothetical protein
MDGTKYGNEHDVGEIRRKGDRIPASIARASLAYLLCSSEAERLGTGIKHG